MTGDELCRVLRRLARRRAVAFHLDTRGGKGSHVKLRFGDRRTVLPKLSKEIPPGTLSSILRALGLSKEDLT